MIALLALTGMAITQTRQFVLHNNCAETVWVRAGTPTPVFNGSSGGLELPAGAMATTSVTTPWAMYTISTTPENGFTAPVALTTSNVPEGITPSFAPASITGAATSTLTLSASALTLPAPTLFQSQQPRVHWSIRSTSLTIQPSGPQFTDLDIGAPGTPGRFSNTTSTFTVSGSGSDIFGTADRFNYAYQTATGDFTITFSSTLDRPRLVNRSVTTHTANADHPSACAAPFKGR